jgi:SAM-dependent methyltransferase
MNKASTILFKLRWHLIHRGPRETLRLILRQLTGHPDPPHTYPIHPFDLQYGLDTSGLLDALQLNTRHPHAVYTTAYHGIPPSRFRSILNRWLATPPQHPIQNYTFIDLGCGKGRAVLLASQLPFKEVIGVELNPTLAQTAADNLRIWQSAGHATSPARILCQDATEFTLPPTPCLIYLYNPFAPPIVHRLIQHIEHSHPTPLDVLYFTPDSGHLFAQHPSFLPLWTEHIPISPEDSAAEPVTDVEDLCSAFRRTPGTP